MLDRFLVGAAYVTMVAFYFVCATTSKSVVLVWIGFVVGAAHIIFAGNIIRVFHADLKNASPYGKAWRRAASLFGMTALVIWAYRHF